jgi:serine/threonine protein kinase
VTGDPLRLPYFVMERLNGQSLRAVLEKKGRLELPHAYHIGIDLLDALDHAHDKGVIHRDVKPDNIFLHRTSAGVTVTKLLDFGIVSLLDATLSETAGRFLGTLRYAAPEQLRGEKPTPRMDVYAAGLVLYEMIAGRGPFDREGDTQAIGAAHIEKPPPSLSSLVAIPPELDALIMAALAKAPEARPRDAFTFAASLRQLKRTLAGSQTRESTEDRATDVAIPGPDSALASRVEVRHPSPEGAYVISPVRRASPLPLTGLPLTTLPGVTPPTLGPSLVDPMTTARTATTPEEVDRLAPTHSLAPDTVASPRHGTDALAGNSLQPAAPSTSSPPSSSDSPFRWPNEGVPATSEEPHPQTLSVTVPRSRSMVRIIAALAVLGTVSAVGVLLFAHPPSSSSPEPGAALPQKASPAPSMSAQVVPSMPASAHAFPQLGLSAATTPILEATSPPPKASVGPARPKARPVAPGSASPAARPVRSDRPGPGF